MGKDEIRIFFLHTSAALLRRYWLTDALSLLKAGQQHGDG
nr:C320 [uncultured bacterium]ART37926.1 F533 [uncultured bacterium]